MAFSRQAIVMETAVVGDDDCLVISVKQSHRDWFEFHEHILFMLMLMFIFVSVGIFVIVIDMLFLSVMMFGKNENVRPLNNNGIGWQSELIGPFFNRQSQVKPLSGAETPLLKLPTVFVQCLSNFVWKFDKKANCLSCLVDVVVNAKQLQHHLRWFGFIVAMGRFHSDLPFLLGDLLKGWQVNLESGAFNVKPLMIGDRAERVASRD